MIIVCPSCQARYLVAAALFAKGSRQVRCARCSHQWVASLEDKLVEHEHKALFDTLPPPDHVAPIPQGSGLPMLTTERWPPWLPRLLAGTGLALVALILIVMIVNRENFAQKWPSLESFYDVIGFHIYHPGDGLRIADVRSELHYEEGINRLRVSGKIVNTTKKLQILPPLVATAIGSSGEAMQSWQVDLSSNTLDEDGELPFLSSINAPKGTVVEMNLNFVEAKKNEPKQ